MNAKKRPVSLKTQIMASTLIPVIASFALISVVSFISLLNSLNNMAEARFIQISQKYAYSFEVKIDNAMNYLSILASELGARAKTDSMDRETLQKEIMRVFDDYGLIDGSSVYFEPDMYDGKDSYYLGSEYGTDTSGRICWYFYKDNGQTVYMPEGLENDVEFGMPHYTEAKQANKPVYTDPVTYEIDGKTVPMFTLTYPIHGNSGEFIGAVTVDLFLDDIYALLQNEQVYETGYIIISNDNGYVISSPRYGDIGGTREEAGLDYPLPSGNGASTFFNSQSIVNGKDTLVTIEPVYINQLDSYFYVSVSAPLEEINAEGIRMAILLAGFGLFVIVAIALLVYYLIVKFLTPLNEITESVNKIASGDYHTRIKGDFRGEFAVVKASVNKMSDSIEAYMEESQDSLNILKNILNGLDAYLYVSDTSTDEILFINEKMKTHFGLESDGVGRICWQVLQSGFEKKCEFCPCYQLDKDPGTPVVWEEHNTVTGRYYRNTDLYIDWVGGKKAHLQHSVDITDIKMAQFALDERLGQQILMASISQSFLSNEDAETLISNALSMIGEFMGISQILFYEFNAEKAEMTCRNEWINPQLDLQARIGGAFVVDNSLLSLMKNPGSKQFCLSSDDPATKEAMKPYRMNFSDYITTPVFIKNKIIGILDFSRNSDGRKWSESDTNLTILFSSLLSGVFERHFMEEQLRRLSSIVESSSQLILYATSDGKVDYVNPAVKMITGYTGDELINGGLDIIFDEQTVHAIKEVHIPNTLRGGTDNFEIDMICKDGRKRIMAFSSFTTGQGSAHVGGIASDVTEIRKLESDLIAAKELAEQGSRSKSEFLSRMSHEMRTPMNAIIGMTTIARNSEDTEKKEYCLGRIDNASRHLLGVINDILDMSKIEANKFELSYSEFSFERMLMGVLDVINFRIGEKQQDFSLYIDPEIPATIIGDEQRLAQVMTNLLTNAVKFTPENGSIQLNAYVQTDENGTLTLRIETIDSGIGISKEQQAKLFRSFEQADGSIARKFGGTGLGLAISKRIVELMDGKIWVDSELGKGSSFIFTFKAERGESSPVDSSIQLADIGKLNIMAVDDSLEVRDYFAHIMDKFGVQCVATSGGTEALELIKSSPKPFDILFIDWKMPHMDGVELTRELRKITGEQPVVIMISVAEWGDIEKDALEAGVNGFISKPLFPSQLMDCINRHFGSMTMTKTSEKEEVSSAIQSLDGKTALLAEDVEINREIILTVLEGTGLRIECAENGREAIEMFTANPEKYNIIFMDVHMPEVDGLEATRRIRASGTPEGSRVPIVAMTANVFREDVEKCLEAGMNDHIGKPINFDELFEKIRRYLK